VIQQADSEQAQALATNDPSLMSDTATAGYYRQLVQINQQMAAQGVTSIQLTNLTWGPISINGTTATATSYETWLTTYSDGTTSESTDTNNYTLVQQNGSWLIESDQQPTTSASPGSPSAQPTPPAVPQPAPLPAATTSAATSHNWSGYAATNGTFTGVSGTWTVPQPSSSSATTGVGATWVGIGGVSSQDLIQAGTQDVTSGGQHQFQSWIEMLPAASQQVPLAVAPGNSVTVSIIESGPGSGTWQISLKNTTTGQTYQTSAQYTSSQSSAEWIEEAPASGNGRSTTILPLDNFGTISFTGATTVDNGQTADLAQSGAKSITMLNSANQALAVPSTIGSDGSSFNVMRTSASATTTPVGRGGQRGGGTPPAIGR
jgi:Peptidase A4 family